MVGRPGGVRAVGGACGQNPADRPAGWPSGARALAGARSGPADRIGRVVGRSSGARALGEREVRARRPAGPRRLVAPVVTNPLTGWSGGRVGRKRLVRGQRPADRAVRLPGRTEAGRRPWSSGPAVRGRAGPAVGQPRGQVVRRARSALLRAPRWPHRASWRVGDLPGGRAGVKRSWRVLGPSRPERPRPGPRSPTHLRPRLTPPPPENSCAAHRNRWAAQPLLARIAPGASSELRALPPGGQRPTAARRARRPGRPAAPAAARPRPPAGPAPSAPRCSASPR